MAWPVAASQRRAVRSWLAVTMRVPSGLKVALSRPLSCRSGTPAGLPVAAFQICAVKSRLALTTLMPSGLKAAVFTQFSCRNVLTGAPVAASHTRAV